MPGNAEFTPVGSKNETVFLVGQIKVDGLLITAQKNQVKF